MIELEFRQVRAKWELQLSHCPGASPSLLTTEALLTSSIVKETNIRGLLPCQAPTATVYLNCPGGRTYSVLAIYDCMSWIKSKVGTLCFGVVASQGALLVDGEKGMRYAMPNAHIMIHQPQSGCGKIDKMYAAFARQPLEKVQQYTERDRFLSVSEASEFDLIDGVLETEYWFLTLFAA